MMIETTAAKIGRSIKKRENMGLQRFLLLCYGDVDSPRLVVGPAADKVLRRLESHTLGREAFGNERATNGFGTLLGELDIGGVVSPAVRVTGDVDGVGAPYHCRSEAVEKPHRLGVQDRLSRREMHDQRRPGRARRRSGVDVLQFENVGR